MWYRVLYHCCEAWQEKSNERRHRNQFGAEGGIGESHPRMEPPVRSLNRFREDGWDDAIAAHQVKTNYS
jgi:hypothetical protein